MISPTIIDKNEGPTEIRTRIVGFKVQSDSHYTIRPWLLIFQASFKNWSDRSPLHIHSWRIDRYVIWVTWDRVRAYFSFSIIHTMDKHYITFISRNNGNPITASILPEMYPILWEFVLPQYTVTSFDKALSNISIFLWSIIFSFWNTALNRIELESFDVNRTLKDDGQINGSRPSEITIHTVIKPLSTIGE